jgi:spore germination protein
LERISSRQIILIGAAYVLNATSISVPSQIIGVAQMDAWLSYVSAGSVILFSLWILSKVMGRFPEQDLYEAMIKRLPTIGRCISLLYIGFFFFLCARDIRMVTDFVNLALLQRTPIVVVAVMIVVTIILIARGGIEISARMTELWFPVFFMIVILIAVVIYREFEYKFLRPFFEFGLVPSFKGGWYAVSYIGEVTALPFIFSNRTFQFKHGWIALSLGLFALLLLNFYTILSLGTNIPEMTLYPSYEMVRHLRVTDFLDRFDLPVVGVWLPTMLTKIAFSLYIVCHGLKRVLPSVSAKIIVTPVGILAFVCSFWFFESAIQLFNFNRTWTALALIFQLFIPVILFLFLKPKKRAKKRRSA